MQRDKESKLRVVSYLSKALTEAQKAYGVHERELLALLYCLEAWRSYFFGTTVTCWTDSTAVAWLVKPSSNHSGRLLRWLIRLGEFNTDVRHKSGVTNHLPDFMSRCGAPSGSQTPSREPPPLAVLTRSQSRTADDSKAQPRRVDEGDVKAMDVSTDPPVDDVISVVDDGSSDDDSSRTLGLSHSSVSDVRREPLESLLPDCDVKDDIQATRPDIVLYSDVDDVLGLFRKHQTADIAHHFEGVYIDRINMEKVVLHLADNFTELGQVAAEYAVAVHTLQLRREQIGCFEDAHKQSAVFFAVAKVTINQVAMQAYLANSGGANALYLIVFTQYGKELKQGRGIIDKHRTVGGIQIVVAY